jgi:16S rRNA A1518/A1519 N6-dimethyltransferase RsmA/KsgA/DIM1 with predicted DNA glycosylase/AP lyase activity
LRLERLGIDPRTRAEDLSGEEWLRLYNALQEPQGLA